MDEASLLQNLCMWDTAQVLQQHAERPVLDDGLVNIWTGWHACMLPHFASHF